MKHYIQEVHAAQYQKNKQPDKKKMSGKPKQTFLQRRLTDGQQTYENILNISHYQRNANQNYNEVLPKIYKQ